MLELKHITKVYEAGTTQVEALKGIDIAFRENEFVAILGQSGHGPKERNLSMNDRP